LTRAAVCKQARNDVKVPTAYSAVQREAAHGTWVRAAVHEKRLNDARELAKHSEP
jgi:hypothetical protein